MRGSRRPWYASPAVGAVTDRPAGPVIGVLTWAVLATACWSGPGDALPVEQAAPAPPPHRGGRIVFESIREGDLDIFVMDADGRNQINLTADYPGDDASPSWSPDGAEVAFQREGPDGNVDIYVMLPDGTGVARLTTDPAFDGAPAWSPDGTRIAFFSQRNGGFGSEEIYVMDADGRHQVNLSRRPGRDANPAWSPDGSKIAFDGDGQIIVMDADGTGQVNLSANDGIDTAPAWSADGTLIAFETTRDGDEEIYVMDAADGRRQTNVTVAATSAETDPSWGADGRLLFVSTRARPPFAQIYVMDLDGSGLATLGAVISSNDYDPEQQRI
jgi:Tol biopolymer transport system component